MVSNKTPLIFQPCKMSWSLFNDLTDRYNCSKETHNFKFAKHVSDDRHPSSVVNTSEPLVGVI